MHQETNMNRCCEKFRCEMRAEKDRMCHDFECECHRSPATNSDIESIVAEFKEKFTYGVIYSASSDLSGGRGTNYKGDNAKPAIEWLTAKLTQFATQEKQKREEMMKKIEEILDGVGMEEGLGSAHEFLNEEAVGFNKAKKEIRNQILNVIRSDQ